MSWTAILLWGFVATLVLTATMSLAQGLGLTRISMPFLVGTAFTPERARARVIGFGVHLLIGWLSALLYAAVFHSLGQASWWLGAGLGVFQGVFVLVALMPLLPEVHPRMASEQHGPTPTRQLEPPGFLALHYGRRTPVVILIAHALYGAILGSFYRP
jgi:hypothetical protein